MNWDKTKNIIITVLILLNVLLGFMTYIESNRYGLSQERIDAIYSVLFQNRVGFYAQMIRESQPMRQLAMQPYEYDMEELKRLFFTGDNVKRMEEFDKMTLRSPDEVLTLQHGYLTYENQNGLGMENGKDGWSGSMDEETAQRLCDGFLEKWGKEFKDFKKDNILQTSEGWILDYCQTYRGAVIYSNFFTFIVTDKGIEKVVCRYSRPLGYDGNAREICFADEAIFTFIHELKNLYGDKDRGLLINRMDLVYFQEESASSKDTAFKAAPYYRFYIVGENQPYLINAYTNVYVQALR